MGSFENLLSYFRGSRVSDLAGTATLAVTPIEGAPWTVMVCESCDPPILPPRHGDQPLRLRWDLIATLGARRPAR